jgi:predicted nucleotidyltransferase
MRLSVEQVAAIRKKLAQIAGESARVWLFGSRLTDDAWGGDVNLLLELGEPVAEPAQRCAVTQLVR